METPHSQPPQPRNPSSRPLPDLVSFPLLDLLLSRLSRRSTFGAAHPASAMQSAGFLPLPCDGCHGCTAADGRKGVGGLLARDCCKEEQGKVPPPCVATDPVISHVAAIGSPLLHPERASLLRLGVLAASCIFPGRFVFSSI
jgi:hypothetical protein